MTILAGLLLLSVLGGGMFLLLKRFGLMDISLRNLLLVALLIHVAAAYFIYTARVYPFGGGEGDQLFYHRSALEISKNFRQGDFSIENIREELKKESMDQSYPVFVALFYALTVQDKFIGQMISVWFFLLSLVILYFVMKEIGVGESWRFRTGIIAALYPSYLYFSSMMLKESLIAFLFLLSLLLSLKLMKHVSFKIIIFLFLVLFFLFHFRLYVGIAALGGFALALLLSQAFPFKKKLAWSVAVFLLAGFMPLFAGKGYFGVSEIRSFLQPQRLAEYNQRVGDSASPHTNLFSLADVFKNPSLLIRSLFPEDSSKNITPSLHRKAASSTREDSKGGIGGLLKTLPQSFLAVLWGPFPWEMKYTQQLFALAETIPWYIISFLLSKNLRRLSKHWRIILSAVFMGMVLLLIIAAFTNNYGTYIRIRIPAFLALLSILPFALSYEANRYPHVA